VSCHPFSVEPPAGPRICVIDPSWRVQAPTNEGYFFLAQRLLADESEWNAALARASEKHGFILDNGAFEQETVVDQHTLTTMFGELLDAGAGSQFPMVLVSPDFPARPFEETVAAYKRLCDRLAGQEHVMLVPQSMRGDRIALHEAFKRAADLRAQWVGISILTAPIAYATQLPLKLLGKSTRELCRSLLIYDLLQHDYIRYIPNLHLLGLGDDVENARGYACLLGEALRSIDSHKPAKWATVTCAGLGKFNLLASLLHCNAAWLRQQLHLNPIATEVL